MGFTWVTVHQDRKLLVVAEQVVEICQKGEKQLKVREEVTVMKLKEKYSRGNGARNCFGCSCACPEGHELVLSSWKMHATSYISMS